MWSPGGCRGCLKWQNYNENGKADGAHVAYYDDKQLFAKCLYIDGKIEGKLNSYYQNGQPMKEENYSNLLVPFMT